MWPAELSRLHHHLGLLALGLARSLPLVWLIPAVGGPAITWPLRMAFAVALAGLCLPILSTQVHSASALSPFVVDSVGAWLRLVRELCVGGAMGFACAAWFRAAEAAGHLTDTLSGNVGAYGSSGGGAVRGPFGGLMAVLATVIFLRVGGIARVTMALAQSYDALPVAGHVAVTATTHAFAVSAIVASAKLIESSLGLCAPVVVALMLADLVVGLVGRGVPGFGVAMPFAPVKALLAIGVFLFGLGGLQAALQGRLTDFLVLVRSAAEVQP